MIKVIRRDGLCQATHNRSGKGIKLRQVFRNAVYVDEKENISAGHRRSADGLVSIGQLREQ